MNFTGTYVQCRLLDGVGGPGTAAAILRSQSVAIQVTGITGQAR